MKPRFLPIAAVVLVLSAMSGLAAIRYVNLDNTNPTAPYTNWTTAATTIQDAVDAALAGDQILVTNGVYQTGGRVVVGAPTNRVAVNKPVTVRSVNGAAATEIQGSHLTRCVYLSSGAALVGFTLTNGSADYGGGVWCESHVAVVSNCTLSGNSAAQGGGASGGTLYNCEINGNSCDWVDGGGGGVANCTLYNCILTGNSASAGGGAYLSTLNNCTLTGNSASVGGWLIGGGAYLGTLNNCVLVFNSSYEGGGVYGGTLNNCTLTANSAIVYGGGASGGTLNNCIVYYNHAPIADNYDNSSLLSYSCTTPLPPDGPGNISAEPQLADFSHLLASSPCRGAGNATYTDGADIDGETWITPPSIGCDEYRPGAITGPLKVSIQSAYTGAAVGVAVDFTAAIDGRPAANRWEFGDGTVLSNRPYASHSWTVAGDYSVVFQAYNDTYPSGIAASVTVHVVTQPVHYVALGSANPVAPYSSWAMAATNIQDAVDAASEAGAVVLVTNGVYQTGNRVAPTTQPFPNRVAVTKPILLRSVNGAGVTVIQGFQDPNPNSADTSVRCVYLTSGATLVGFTLTQGGAPVICLTSGNNTVCTGNAGGGVMSESVSAVVSNCVLSGNSADYGGGASAGTLYNCVLSGNSASGEGGGADGSILCNCKLIGNSSWIGGGADWCTLNNCSISANSASFRGGGVNGGTLNNCIVYYNTAPNGDNYLDSFLSHSCTTPLPPNGIGNLANAPLFADYAGGNLRLQSNSPCINAGSNASAPAGPDLDGNPRTVGGTVDVGAYEFQSPLSIISYGWLQQYGLHTDGSADYTDSDGDGSNNWQEWRAGTDPTNALSALRLLSPVSTAPGVIVSWQSVSGRNYFVERGTDLGAQTPFLPLATDIVGQPGTTTFTDTHAVGAGPFFYRIGVR